MTNIPSYQILRDLLSGYFVDDKDVVNELAVDVAIHFCAMSMTWDKVLEGVDADEDLVWAVKYVIQGSFDGEPVREPQRYPATRRYVTAEIKKRCDEKLALRFDEIIDTILYGGLKSKNQFFVDYEQPLLYALMMDVQMQGLKHLFKKTNPKIAQAYEVAKWQFLSTIALFVGGPIKQFELGARVSAMRDAELRE